YGVATAYHPTFAGGDGLGCVKAKRAYVTECPAGAALIARKDGRGAIREQEQTVTVRHRTHHGHVCHNPVVVNHHDCFGLGSDLSFDIAHVHAPGFAVNVGKYWHTMQQFEHVGSCHKPKGRKDDLIAGTD